MIRDLLQNKTSKQKANIKGREIAKIDFRGEYISQEHGVKIDIQSIKEIEGGVEVLAKAWRGNKQLGFGKDGSVEIERFNIYNPPILVSDPNGDIIKEWSEHDYKTDTTTIYKSKFREDPSEAIRQTIVHNVKITGKENTNIIKGKIGNTTSTFFPAAGANSPVDGTVDRTGVDEVFGTIVAGAGNSSDVTATSNESIDVVCSTTVDQFLEITRLITLFDTSSIPDADVIDSATLSLWAVSKNNGLSGSPEVDIVASTPASNDNLVDADYGQLGTTVFSSIAYSAITTSAYNDFTLDANGEADISKTGISKFGARNNWDTDNSFAGTWVSLTNARVNVAQADTSGTANDPKLVVEHSAVSGPANVKSWNGLSLASIKSINGLAIASVKSINSLE